ncbi:YibE/F family protein [Patescibacteria group bacterium]|nr:MAG: YibE/F family protein [Patescibacteria group bacterium]
MHTPSILPLREGRKRFIIFILTLFFILFLPAGTYAANETEAVFKAKVIKILEQKETTRPDGRQAVQQNLLLRGLEGKWEDKEFNVSGISDLDVLSSGVYKVNDKVLVNYVKRSDGTENFYAVDYVRQTPLLWLTLIFALVVLLVGKKKGLLALVGLAISFFLIIKIIVPLLMKGVSPLPIALFGAFAVLAIIIYLNEGWNKKSHLAIVSVLLSLAATFFLSWLFTKLARLSGLGQEEAMFLIGANKGAINFQGLLLSGILIGAIGVLDDVIVGQIEAVREIKNANPSLSPAQVFTSAYKIGNAHLGALVNTLFLTYAGASLPVLLLFHIQRDPPLSWAQAINNETIATEIVRTLVGSIGVALSVPIATLLAAYWLGQEKK